MPLKHGPTFINVVVYLIVVSTLFPQKEGINMLFVIGGNGTHAGAQAIHSEVSNPTTSNPRPRHIRVCCEMP